MIKSFLRKIETRWSTPWFNPLLTVYLNFRFCSFKDACKLPLFFYGKVCLDQMFGKVIFPNGCYKGMVRIGQERARFGRLSDPTYFFMHKDSLIKFNGGCTILQSCCFRLDKRAIVEIGKDVLIADRVKICAEKEIHIGDYTGIAHESQIFDTDFHYMVNLNTNKIRRKNAPVHIGRYNWIGNRVSILKGTSTPDRTIIASNSVLNKNYGTEENIVLAGTPAMIRKHNVLRIFSYKLENIVNKQFCLTEENEIDFLNQYSGLLNTRY